MNHKALKIVLTAAVVTAAFGSLVYTSLGDSLQYYKYVDEVMADPQAWQGKPLRIHGYVVAGSIKRNPASREYRFEVQRNGKVVRASYTGSPPDAFKNDAEVVLTGILSERGFAATDMTAQCPSKYEEGPAKPSNVVVQGTDAPTR
jgi:cytochrome c-type biogenesis protein CcmE